MFRAVSSTASHKSTHNSVYASSVLSLMAVNVGKRAAVTTKSCEFLVKIINNAVLGSMAQVSGHNKCKMARKILIID